MLNEKSNRNEASLTIEQQRKSPIEVAVTGMIFADLRMRSRGHNGNLHDLLDESISQVCNEVANVAQQFIHQNARR